MSVPVARPLRLPRFPAREQRGGFPVASAVAPVVAAAVIWAITGSPYSLLFAAAAPLAAVGAVLDRRIRGGRRRRAAIAATRESLRDLGARVEVALERRRVELRRGLCDPWAVLVDGAGSAWRGGDPRILWGAGRVASGIDLGDADDAPEELRSDVEALVRHASAVDRAPVSTEAVDVGVLGPPPLARAAVRWLAVQLCAQLDPGETVVRTGIDEDWVTALPHRVETAGEYAVFEARTSRGVVRVAWAATAAGLPSGLRATLALDPGGCRLVRDGVPAEVEDLEPALLSASSALRVAQRLHAAAREVAGGRACPDAVRFADLGAVPVSGSGLPTVLGVGPDGPLEVDLVRDGPHAIIGGTSGSGKSETLIAWIVGLAERHPPDRVAFLLIDFKGGSAFAQLAALPHVVGTVSDLDPALARRATASLTAEILRRERVLADRGLRDISEAPDEPRLVVVVDEYAALVSEQPELHETIADLASRGRSLGIHLLLCTQRPAGVIREQVLANAGLRVCLRVTSRADSVAVVGDASAAELGGAPPGRAVVIGGDGERRTVQTALVGPEDLASAVGRPVAEARAFRPWADPLPASVGVERLAGPGPGIPFGLVDLPEQQRVEVARFSPERDGNLLVVGGRGRGTTTALTTIAEGAGARAVVVPREAADAWGTLREVLERGASPTRDGAVVVLDDADLLLDGADEDVRPGLLRLLAALARELPARSGALVLGAARVPSAASPLLSRVDGRLILGLPDRESHVLAGGSAGDWSERRAPGRGTWHGREVQVATPRGALSPHRVPVPALELDERPLAIASGRPARVLNALAPRRLADPATWGGGGIAVGDPEEWAGAWTQAESARRDGRLLVVDGTPVDLRALARLRQDPPPLAVGRPEGWLLHGRDITRVALPWLGAS